MRGKTGCRECSPPDVCLEQNGDQHRGGYRQALLSVTALLATGRPGSCGSSGEGGAADARLPACTGAAAYLHHHAKSPGSLPDEGLQLVKRPRSGSEQTRGYKFHWIYTVG